MISSTDLPPDQSLLPGVSGMSDVRPGFPALSQSFTQSNVPRKSRPLTPPIGPETDRSARISIWLAEAAVRVKVGADFVVRRQVKLALGRKKKKGTKKRENFAWIFWNDFSV